MHFLKFIIDITQATVASISNETVHQKDYFETNNFKSRSSYYNSGL